MEKMIAVLGMKHDFEFLKKDIENIDVLFHIKSIEELQGREFSSYILLENWNKAYRFPSEVLSLLKHRVR